MNPKVSIIVPIHNAGVHLKKCIDTLVNQTLKDIEIILVLDCPTDGSDAEAIEYARKDPRIKIIRNTQNLNIGLSRNEGLKIATGEYIGFSDHDDWREAGMYEKLYFTALTNQADIVLGRSQTDYVSEGRNLPSAQYPEETPDELKKQVLAHLIGDFQKNPRWKDLTTNGSMWQHLYKKELLTTNNIFFQDNRYCTFEDLLFLIKALFFAHKVVYVPQIFYYHLIHSDNTQNKYCYYSTENIIEYLKQLYLFLTANHIKDEHALDFAHTVLHFLRRSIANEIKYKSYKSAFRKIMKIRENKFIIESISDLPIYRPGTIRKLKVQKTLLWLALKI